MSEWQPIKTAPKGRVILLFAVTDLDENGKVRNWKMETGHWSYAHEDWCWPRALLPWETKPTHWMPLPEPPQ